MQTNQMKGFRIPFISMSEQGTLDQKTGMWGRMRPFLFERPAPCQRGCPAGIPIPRVLGYLQEKRYEEAIESIRMENPLPRITGRVCFHPCEKDCNRKEFDQPISIRSLERFLSDHSYKPQKMEPNGKRVAVIGSGPAGLSCSYYLTLLGYQVTLFEGEKELGGMLRFGIPEYRLPKEILDREIEDILSLGIKPMVSKRVGKDMSFEEIERNYDSIFIATGAWKGLKIGIPGEESQGFEDALDFLKRVNKGERLTVGKNVLVIGGGNTALDAARTCLRMGTQVRVIYRRSRQEIPALTEEVEEGEEEGVQILYLTSPLQVLVKNGEVKGLECIKNRLVQPGKDGRALPELIPGSNHVLEADMILTAVGESSDLSFLPPGSQFKEGRVERMGEVSEKVFFGGDLLPQPRTVVHAIQSGKEGAIQIDQYLRDGKKAEKLQWISMSAYRRGLLEPQGSSVRFEELNMSYFTHQDRLAQKRLSPETRMRNFEEVNQPISEDSAIEETQRCFQCGLCNICKNCYIFCPDFIVTIGEKVAINYDYCKGCCICVEECPRGVMRAEVKI